MYKMKKQLAVLLSAAMLTGTLGMSAPYSVTAEASGIQKEIYISPAGDDAAGDGSQEKPYASLEKAKSEVQKINSDMTGDIYVYLDGGEYYMDKTVEFGPEDSGTNGHQIIYASQDGVASAKLIGGRPLDNSNWELVQSEGANDADLPAEARGHVYKMNVGTEQSFNTLYVNDRRATQARYPNLDQYPGFTAALTPYLFTAGGGMHDLQWKEGDLPQQVIDGLSNAAARGDLDASIYMWDGGYWDWMTDTIPLKGIDPAQRRLHYKDEEIDLDGSARYRPKYTTGNNARYFLQGNLALLDQEGEYYYNKTTGDLYYYPTGNIEDQQVIIPLVKEVIRAEGKGRDAKVSNLTFRGIEMKDTESTDWYAYGWNAKDTGAALGFWPNESKGSTQPSYCEQREQNDFRYGVITLKNTDGIRIEACHLTNSGMFGIAMYDANTNALIENSLIDYTGHGGINMDGGYPGLAGDENGNGYARDNMVKNVLIHDIGELIGQASGLTVQQVSHSTFSNIEVYNSPRRGIFTTGGTSREKNGADKNYDAMKHLYTHSNLYEYCYIHDCQQDGGDDGAFFGCMLFHGNEDGKGKPNIINQMVIDSTGANPTMKDLSPNNMNLDMGCSGFELHNVKSVNPMNFNIEVNTILQYKDDILFDNVNIDYGTMVNHLAEFDDSKMEYDKIGLTEGFPIEYMDEKQTSEKPDDIYFEDDFEKGIQKRKWTFRNAQPEITTEWMSEDPFVGKQGLIVNQNSVLSRTFQDQLNKTVTVKMFDRQTRNMAGYDSGVQNSANALSYVSTGTKEEMYGLGIEWGKWDYYYMNINGEKIPTNVPRLFGWHELKFDYSTPGTLQMYIDDTLVKEVNSSGFDTLDIGSDAGKGIVYYDEAMIYGGVEAPPAGELPLPKPPAEPEDKILYEEDFESYEMITEDAGNQSHGEDAIQQSILQQNNIANDSLESQDATEMKTEAGVTEAAVAEESVTEKVETEEAETEEAVAEVSNTEVSNTEVLNTEVPNTEVPNTEVSVTDEPITEEPEPRDQMINIASDEEQNKGSQAMEEPAPAAMAAADLLPDWKGVGGGKMVKELIREDNNQYLRINSQDNTFYYTGGSEWKNYVLEAKVRLNRWTGDGPLGGAYDVFCAGVRFEEDPNSKSNPHRYTLKMEKSGKLKFYMRSSGDKDFFTKTPEEVGMEPLNPPFAGRWYDLKIVADGDKISSYIDGNLIGTVVDGNLQSGGIGFNALGGEYDIDDMKVTKVQTPEPGIEPDSGTYEKPIEVKITPASKKDQIFYTLDGSDPKDPEHGIYYEGSFVLPENDKPVTLKCVAIRGDSLYSEVVEKTYVIKTHKPEITALEEVQIDTIQGIIPKLPQTVKASYNNGTTAMAAVQWEPVTDQQVAVPGKFMVLGSVDGTALNAKAVVTVLPGKEDPKPEIKVNKVTLNETKKTVLKGKSFTLKAAVSPADAVNKNIVWSTSNAKAATVDQTGKVTAKGYGTATIKAQAADGSGKYGTCKVTVGYKINYHLNKGTNSRLNPTSFYKTKVTLKAPSRKGYTFKGWYTDKKMKKRITSISSTSRKNISVYAKWEKIKIGKTSIGKVQSKKAGSMAVNWKKVKNAGGYEIIYGNNSRMTKGKKVLETKGTGKTIKKLKKGRTYYVKVRGFKIDSAGKKVYGAYSKVERIKIKK